MAEDWTGKVVLVTGGSGGIGGACVEQFRSSGARVVVADIRGTGMEFIRTDVSKPLQCEAAVAETLSTHGRLDLLINAAGVWTEGPSAGMSEEQWDHVVGVNLKGAFFMCRHAIPALVSSGGQIINIASDAGLIGNAGAAIYCASKGGLVLLTKALALELAPQGVRVNAICPCDVDTPMLHYQAEAFGNGDAEGYLEKLRAIYPQGPRQRFAAAAEIAHFVFTIASPQLAPITGAALSIDFGTTAGR